MTGRLGLVLAILGLATSRAGDLPPSVRGEAPPVAAGPLLFQFNHRDLTGFSTFLRHQHQVDPARVFAVDGGDLRISGTEFGGITTTASFRDYHLVAEWRWGGPTHFPRRWGARNSGILVHCVGAEGDGLGSWMAGLENQLIEGGTGDLIIVPGKDQPSLSLASVARIGPDGQPYYQPGGTAITRSKGRLNWWGRDPEWHDILWFRGPRDLEHAVGAWNRTDLICAGDRITAYLNGQIVNAATELSRTSGRVLFQSEGAEIRFHKIEIRALSAKPRQVGSCLPGLILLD